MGTAILAMTFSSLARVAHDGSTLMVSYTGTLDNGQQFASGIKNFTLGAGQGIKGWDQGLVGMKVGQTRDLSISPQDGYGASVIPWAASRQTPSSISRSN